jgi:hypothetical protein
MVKKHAPSRPHRIRWLTVTDGSKSTSALSVSSIICYVTSPTLSLVFSRAFRYATEGKGTIKFHLLLCISCILQKFISWGGGGDGGFNFQLLVFVNPSNPLNIIDPFCNFAPLPFEKKTLFGSMRVNLLGNLCPRPVGPHGVVNLFWTPGTSTFDPPRSPKLK